MSDQTATCRGCGMALKGKPYYMGGSAYHPTTKERCKVNFYGGFVCSPSCDHNSSLRLEQTMPGHGYEQRSFSVYAEKDYKKNWEETE